MTTAVAGATPAVGGASAAGFGGRAFSTITGTWPLVRFVIRLDRVRIPVWIVGIALTVLLSAASVADLYPTQADLDAAAAPLYDNTAIIALQGPTYGIDTLGGNIVFNIGGFGYVIVGLMGMFLVGRHTRAEEEAGRTELLRAGVVGRNAPVAAALVVTGAALAVLGVVIALTMLTQDVPVTGSIAYGAAMAAFGLVFAAVTSVTAQLTEHNRASYGMTGALLGLSFVIRAIGDVGDGTLSWLSPMGWAQSVRPYADERWWPLLLLVGTAIALTALAYVLLGRRDLGGGMVAARPGRAEASPWLSRRWGLAARLQRATLTAWTVGLALSGIVYGSLGEDVDDLIGDNQDIADVIAQAGGNLTDSYFATSLLMLAVIAGGYTVSSALRTRSEETSGRAEPLLATALSRSGWAGSHLAMAAAGSVVVAAATGLGMGATYGLIAGDAGQVLRLTGAALAYVPALWVLAGLAMALFGLVPRLTALTWAAFAWCAVVGLLGGLLALPQWAMNVSPFQHVPQMPAHGVAWGPLAVLTLIAAGLAAVGLAGFRRRDAGY